MYQAVIFDMDGTLLSTESLHSLSINRAIESLGLIQKNMQLPTEEAMMETARKCSGTTNLRSMEIVIEDFKLDILPEDLKIIKGQQLRKIYEEDPNLDLEPGVKALIETLYANGIPMAVASSSPYEEIVYITERFGIKKYFKALVTGEDSLHSKPAPDVFLATAEQLGVSPADCIVFEDSHNGVEAANSAAMLSIGYNNPETPNYDLKDAKIQISSYHNVFENVLKPLLFENR